MNEHPIILFDGVCNLCNRVVRFVISRDKKARIQFAALQSEAGKKLLQQYHVQATAMESFVLIENGKAYLMSSAALKVCRHLKGLWPLCYGFIIVPGFIRNAVYNWVAGHRYKWFGVRAECMIPTTEIKARFLN